MIDFLKDQHVAEGIFVKVSLNLIRPVEMTGKGLPVQCLSGPTHQKHRAMSRDMGTLGNFVFGVVREERATGVGSTGGQCARGGDKQPMISVTH